MPPGGRNDHSKAWRYDKRLGPVCVGLRAIACHFHFFTARPTVTSSGLPCRSDGAAQGSTTTPTENEAAMDTIDIEERSPSRKESGKMPPIREDAGRAPQHRHCEDSSQGDRRHRVLDLEEDLFNNVPV